MVIEIRWLEPMVLQDGGGDYLTFRVSDRDSERLPTGPGIYVFGRRHGGNCQPVCIGRATCLADRIWQQFNNNRLMNALKTSKNGQRELWVGAFVAKPGQQTAKVLHLVERGLIKLALAEGHDVVNVKGTRIRSHLVQMMGSRDARGWLPQRAVQFE